ncbi:integrin beta-7 [Polyodon spathula]|uniref:integrin beta-7 n=1 Tax=Polyodon spathula TaxID=7913 RepID=UPI001B7D9327|nr:integrin beta-7 [Polyodon spathula]
MKWACLLAGFLLQSAGVRQNQVTGAVWKPCESRSSCEECIKSQPDCAWCKQLNFTKAGESDSSRCDSEESLRQRGCAISQIQNPKNFLHLDKNRELKQGVEIRGGEEVVQLQPQGLTLNLRPGAPQSFKVRFRRAEGYPIDLYYLMDLSYSMKDDLENIKKLGQEILTALSKVTRSVKIGFGSFVDKTVLPYVSTVKSKLLNPCPTRLDTCQPPFSFRNVLSLTESAALFEKRVSEQSISGNLDSPEAGFDAMMQAAVCQREIGWRNVTRLLVYTSDDTFHTAGDGRLGGIYFPNDGHCHLNEGGVYDRSTYYDYPSVGQLAQVLSANNIQSIFAVTEKIYPTYQELSRLIPKSAVGVLTSDSSNVVQLICDTERGSRVCVRERESERERVRGGEHAAVHAQCLMTPCCLSPPLLGISTPQNLSSTIYLDPLQLPAGLSISFDSHCGNHTVHGQRRGECTGVKIGQEIIFTVTVTSTECLTGSQHFTIKPQGINEELQVTVTTACNCDCRDEDPSSQHCSHGNGTLHCGVCSCSKGRQGRLCECQLSGDDASDLQQSCRAGNHSALCSGHGRCECGACLCDKNRGGAHCECDHSACPRHNNTLCGGNGKCSCGQCLCSQGFTGEACECSAANTSCVPEAGGELCSGNGSCVCNRCHCREGYIGRHCQTCINCKTDCQSYESCLLCELGGGHCESECKGALRREVQKLPDDTCILDNVIFSVIPPKEEGSAVLIEYMRRMSPPSTLTIVGGSVSGVVFIGLLLIMLYRIIVFFYDRQEYRRFEKARKCEKWNKDDNPLFINATTTVMNPNFEES